MSAVAEEAHVTPERGGKKVRVRDANGRFIDRAPGPGRPPMDPNLKQLAAADRSKNFEFIRGMRDDRKMDPELRFEAAKLLAMYSDGKPTLGLMPHGPLVSMSFGAPAPGEMGATALTPEQAYLAMTSGTMEFDPSHPALAAPRLPHAEPARAPIVVDASPAPPSAAPVPAAPGNAVMAAEDVASQPLPPEVEDARDAWHAERARGER